MSLLTFDNVCKSFYSKDVETKAVENLSFSVEEGEFVAIIGHSGCGKTTLLSLIAGLITQTSGTISCKSNIGYMLQRDELFEWRNIEQNAKLPLELTGNKDTTFVDQLLDKYGLKDFRKSFPSQLSGGMRQRVALIRTLATKPDLLLLDEPFSALDYQTRLNVCDDVYKIIRRENKTAILVTHDISEAISIADKILVLSPRPAKVIDVHYTNLQDIDSPLQRRKSPTFANQFEKLHALLNGENNEPNQRTPTIPI